ncbi:hypothetical protein GE061_007268 [Apolygus lucorum]|uniref:Peptidase S1 domain-containing protein n=1 Tax=Apolygus lucorum TaxID=248454 RepID=A0A6A4J3S1_APOLU|nr:hypothetical protein GE061_007268 [Apolygus lucorum]
MSVQVVFAFFLLSGVTAVSSIRPKRVVDGFVILHDDRENPAYYKAARYYVWIGKPDHGGYPPVTFENRYKCGGVLLTPDIVQTACSCIADFYTTHDIDYKKPTPPHDDVARPLHVFEERYSLYYGSTSGTQHVLKPHCSHAKNYVIYETCKRYFVKNAEDERERPAYSPRMLHNFGLIIMEDRVDKKYGSLDISYAPISTFGDIIKFYWQALQKRLMCLLFGHGGEGLPFDSNDLLNYGWRPLLSYKECMEVSYTTTHNTAYDKNKDGTYDFFYTNDSGWACLISLRPEKAPRLYTSVIREIGGPVMCSGELFGLISQAVWEYTPIDAPYEDRLKVEITLTSPIVFDLYTFSYEYRKDFLRNLEELFKNDKNAFPTPIKSEIVFRPTFKTYAESQTPKMDSPIELISILLIFMSIHSSRKF